MKQKRYGFLYFSHFIFFLFLGSSVFAFDSFPFQSFQLQNDEQKPIAHIAPLNSSLVVLGQELWFNGENSQDPKEAFLFYSWRLVKKPMGSVASFSTPSPMRPLLDIDREGLYVVELIVSNQTNASDPKYLVFSAVQPKGQTLFSSKRFETPLLCALSLGFAGCKEIEETFAGDTSGDYQLNISSDGLTRLSLELNSKVLDLPFQLEEGTKLSIPIALMDQNKLKIKVEGDRESAVSLEVVQRVSSYDQSGDQNTIPSVEDLDLTARMRDRIAAGTLSIADPDVGQSHTVEFLNPFQLLYASLDGTNFRYTSPRGFKGKEEFYLLTYDDGNPQKGVVSKVTVSVPYNTAPRLDREYLLAFAADGDASGDITFRLPVAVDSEGDPISYSITRTPSLGNLNCTVSDNVFICRYQPSTFPISGLTFEYVASDGQLESTPAQVNLSIYPRKQSWVTELSLGGRHSCALFSEGEVSCWGGGEALGYESQSNIGDDEHPISAGHIPEREGVVKISSLRFATCVLTQLGKVKCWGDNSTSTLGRQTGRNDNSRIPGAGIDFGTTLKVIDLAVAPSSLHNCALFENNRIKCWGRNFNGQLGLAHTDHVGTNFPVKSEGFVQLGGGRSVKSLVGGVTHTCALFTDGKVKCWGSGAQGQLGYGNQNTIGDNEHPSAVGFVPLGGEVSQMAAGEYFTCALFTNKKVKCWGYNQSGQLGLGHHLNIGDNELVEDQDFIDVGGSVLKIVAGYAHVCVLLDDYSVKCWGGNSFGELGIGHYRSIGVNELPSSIGSLALREKVVDLSAGGYHTCVLFEGGELRCWGSNGLGQLGLADRESRGQREVIDSFYLPAPKIGGDSFLLYPRFSFSPEEIRVGDSIELNGTLSYSRIDISSDSWNLGDGEKKEGRKISHSYKNAGSYGVKYTLTDALGRVASIKRDIIIYPKRDRPLMPKNQFFKVTQNQILSFDLLPAEDQSPDALEYFLADSPSNGTISGCLGGTSSLSCLYTPTQDFKGKVTFSYKARAEGVDSLFKTEVEIEVVEKEMSIIEIVAGYDHACALFENKKIKCWGANYWGQLGYGHFNNIGDDEALSELDFVNVGADVQEVILERGRTCALLVNESVKCWGNRVSDPSQVSPLVTGFGKIDQLIMGQNFTCVLSEGRVKCWGRNAFGQLGLGHAFDMPGGGSLETVPPVDIGERVLKLAAGNNHVCALLESQDLKCWGHNQYGQVGLKGFLVVGDNEHPSEVPNISVGAKVLDMILGQSHTCALLEDKSVKCWGWGRFFRKRIF